MKNVQEYFTNKKKVLLGASMVFLGTIIWFLPFAYWLITYAASVEYPPVIETSRSLFHSTYSPYLTVLFAVILIGNFIVGIVLASTGFNREHLAKLERTAELIE